MLHYDQSSSGVSFLLTSLNESATLLRYTITHTCLVSVPNLRARQQPRMVFSFDFVSAADLGPFDEGVSLQVLDDGVTPKAPADSLSDGLPKLYVSGNAFLKVLGATLDVDTAKMAPLLYDKEGNRMDPNN